MSASPELHELELVDVVTLHVTAAGTIAWSSAPGRDTAGLEAYASIRYQSLDAALAAADGEASAPADAPVLIGAAGRIPIDGRGDPAARAVHPGEARVNFAADVLEDTLGITVDDVETSNPRVAIFASEGVVAFQRAEDVANITLDEAVLDAVRP